MTRNLVCSECGGTMQRGFIVETTGISYGRANDAAYWLEGKPEKSFFGGLKTKNKQAFYIMAYRCERCGFLKFYAGPENTARN